jgi:excisionase family DNA binding protein
VRSNIKRVSEPETAPGMMLKIPQAARELGISESTMFELLKAEKVRSVYLGPKIRRIPRTELEAYVQRLLDEQYGSTGAEAGAA